MRWALLAAGLQCWVCSAFLCTHPSGWGAFSRLSTFPSSASVKPVGCSEPEFNRWHHHTFQLSSAFSGSCTRFAGSLRAGTLVPFVFPGSEQRECRLTGCPGAVCCALTLTRVRLFATPWTVACQTPQSMGILQARILEWVAMPASRGCSQPRDRTQVSRIAGGFFTI